MSDEEWAFVAPYLALLPEDVPQRRHALREVFNGLRFVVKGGAPWRWMPPADRLPADPALAPSRRV
jgi:transposase